MDPIEAVGEQISYGTPVKRKKRSNTTPLSYTQQEVNLQKTPFLFFPPGKEMLFLAIYFVTLPYIVGLIFLFFFISEGRTSIFGHIGTNASFIMVWAIGYEIIAVFILLMIVKGAIMFSIGNSRKKHPTKKRRFRHP